MQSQLQAARRFRSAPLSRMLALSGHALRAANDNGQEPASAALLEAALRHFARHGLGAARAARLEAERAFFAGDRAAYRWWLDICRQLDKRMAQIADRELGRATDKL